MKTRIVLTIISIAVCAVMLTGTVVQGRRLGELRAEHKQRLTQQEKESETSIASANATVGQTSPSLELLRLRNEVNRLTNRRRELKDLSSANEQLQIQIATSRTNLAKANPLSADYIRKSTARMLGFSSPEATLETMIWAVSNRDLPTFMQSLGPESLGKLQKEIQNKSAEEFFKGSENVPPMRIADRKQLPDGSIQLNVETGEGNNSQLITFRQTDGQWKMEMK